MFVSCSVFHFHYFAEPNNWQKVNKYVTATTKTCIGP